MRLRYVSVCWHCTFKRPIDLGLSINLVHVTKALFTSEIHDVINRRPISVFFPILINDNIDLFLCWGHINHLTVKLLVFTKYIPPTPKHLTVKGGCFAVTVLHKKLSNCFSTGKRHTITGVIVTFGEGMESGVRITMQGRVSA